MKAPKRPSTRSLKETRFSDSIRNLKHKPNPVLSGMLDSKLFPLDGNTVFRYKPDVLASQEYERCLSLLERRVPQAYNLSPTARAAQATSMATFPVTQSIFVKEMRHREELERIAVETIQEMFDIPEHITILPNITDGLSGTEDQDDSPQPVLSLSPERQREMRSEIEKRIILNGLVHGCAMHIWKSAHYIIKEKIDNIDPGLMDMYNIYTAAVGWMIWQIPPGLAAAEIDGHGLAQGKNELEFEEPGEAECSIECSGINFPVLLHEVAKGAMDYLICHGIPQEYTEEELTYYYAKADSYENEYWHYLLSPSLWTSLIEAADLPSQDLPLVIARLTKLSYQDLSTVMKSCIDSPEAGKEMLTKFKIL